MAKSFLFAESRPFHNKKIPKMKINAITYVTG
jgi:hypothetical protein